MVVCVAFGRPSNRRSERRQLQVPLCYHYRVTVVRSLPDHRSVVEFHRQPRPLCYQVTVNRYGFVPVPRVPDASGTMTSPRRRAPVPPVPKAESYPVMVPGYVVPSSPAPAVVL